MKRWLVFVLMVPGLLLGVALFFLSWVLVLNRVPAFILVAAVLIFGVVAAWFFFGRQKSAGVLPGSETSLMGRQSSKEGLL